MQNEESEEKTIENEPSSLPSSSTSAPAIAGSSKRMPVKALPPSSAILKPTVVNQNHLPNHYNHTPAAASTMPSSATTATSATTNSTNSNWNCDSWADGEFEPLEEDTFAGGE